VHARDHPERRRGSPGASPRVNQDLDGWWLAAGAPLTVLGWVDKHLPHQYTYVGRGSFYDSWSDSFTLPGLPAGVISGRDLEVDVVPAGHGQTAIGVRAMVAYAQGPAGR
jgi:hypothetical protein